MTEAEALTKWCPFARGWTTGPQNEAVGGVNRYGSNMQGRPELHPETQCIGADCMAWRWSTSQNAPGALQRGFCGLAGRPAVG